MEKIVITRHKGLVEHLIDKGMIDKDTKVITHAEPSDLKDKHAIGVLPYRLSAYAVKYTRVQLVRLPPDKRNIELTLEDFRWYAQYKTYTINHADFED